MAHLRLCSGPNCGVEITACMGTVKAGDLLECMEGNRHAADIRELCAKCATKAIIICEVPEMQFGYHQVIGWGPLLLPPPTPASS